MARGWWNRSKGKAPADGRAPVLPDLEVPANPGATAARSAATPEIPEPTAVAARDTAARTADEPALPPGAGGGLGLFVRRPILAFVLSSLIVIAGIAGLAGVEIRELPDV
ncbi:MAG: hypothetical protein ACU0CN_14185, partial [Pseudooceanicola nanhaiensis]